MISLLGFNIIDVDGSAVIHEKAEEMGLDHCLITVDGAGHVPHIDIFNPEYYDLTISALAGKLGEWACEDYVHFVQVTTTRHQPKSKSPASKHLLWCFPTLRWPMKSFTVRFLESSEWRLTNVMGTNHGNGIRHGRVRG